jgi:diadenosine tetraphosphatase ApaH/serine/threonine PP2A family protein phosphatase
MSREALGLLRTLEWPTTFIIGNGDREVVAHKAGVESSAVPESFRDCMRWEAHGLTHEEERLITRWPLTIRIEIPGIGDVLFCHATPHNDTDIFTKHTSEDALFPVFEDADADLVVCGHTHMQMDRTVAGIRIVNAGSIGAPFADPGAYWLLLGPDVQFKRTDYDLFTAAERVRATHYPQAAQFAANSILKPATEESILKSLAKAELKSLR